MYTIYGDVDPSVFKGVLDEIQRRNIPINNYRKNSGVGRSQSFGLTRQRNGTHTGSRLNFERPELYQELLVVASKILPAGFTFDSIQVNVNYQTQAHYDKGNRGESGIVAFGEFSGGELVIEGTPVNIRNKLVFFDGSVLLHSTRPYTGTRYSLVFFSLDKDFLEVPKFSFVMGDYGKLWLREDLGGVTRIYDQEGRVRSSSDGTFVKRVPRAPTLRPCIENME